MKDKEILELLRSVLQTHLKEGEEIRLSRDPDEQTIQMLAGLHRQIIEKSERLLYPERDIAREYSESILGAAVILFHVQAGLMLIDPVDHTVAEINPYASDLMGYRREEILGKDCQNYLCPGSGDSCWDCTDDSPVSNSEGWVFCSSGAKIPVLNTLTSIYIKGKAFLLASFVDLTKQKEIERDLIEQRRVAERNEERFLELFENSPSGIVHFMWSDELQDFIIEGFNKAAEEIEQISRREVLGKCLKKMFPGVKDSGYYQVLQEVNRTGKVRKMAAHEYNDDRISGWRESYLYRLSTGGVVSIFNDLTEFIRTQQDLKTSMERFEVAVRGSKDGIFDMNLVTRELYLSPQWKDQLGYLPGELETTYTLFDELLHPDDKERVLDILNRYHTGKLARYEQEFRMQHKDGSYRWILARADAVRDENGIPTRIAGSHTDITRLKETAEELRQARDLADSANKAKSEFLANMSHEIRTPMNAILGFTEIISNKLEQEELRSYINSISSSGKALLRLINDILDLSKIEAGRMEIRNVPTDLRKIIEETRNIFRFSAEKKGLFFRVEYDEKMPSCVMIDELRIRQILLNLIGNSVKFTATGGITLRITGLPKGDPGNINLGIEIEDTGIGIPAGEQKHIFEAFRQTTGQDQVKFGGTGLGLAITRRLVEMMGGEIFLASKSEKDSPSDHGTLFRLLFEGIKVVDMNTGEEEKRLHGNIRFEPSRILVADDVPMNRKLIVGFLEDYPFEILEAANGVEAVRIAQEEKPDLIIMDVKMPEMNGDEATRILKAGETTRSIPVIALTASVVQLENQEPETEIYDSFLFKPVSLDQLLTTLKEYLGGTLSGEEKIIRSDIELMPEEVVQALPVYLEEIRRVFLSRYNDLKGTYILGQLESYAKDVSEYADARGLTLLAEWGKRLQEDVRTFDMEKLPGDLESFPVLLEELEKRIN